MWLIHTHEYCQSDLFILMVSNVSKWHKLRHGGTGCAPMCVPVIHKACASGCMHRGEVHLH